MARPTCASSTAGSSSTAHDGPKTLNGLILEHLQDIPETGVSMKIADTPIEVVQTQDRMVRTARIFRPRIEGAEQ